MEPSKQTHRKLNSYYGASLTSTSFIITRSVVDRIGAEWEWEAVRSEREWYYRIEDYASNRSAVYWLPSRPGVTPLRPSPSIFRGRVFRFEIKTRGGARVSDLSRHAIYTTREEGAFVTSHLILGFLSGAVALRMDSLKRGSALRPPAASRPDFPSHTPSRWRWPYRREGTLQFITDLA